MASSCSSSSTTSLNSANGLTTDQINTFLRDGVLVVPGLLSPEELATARDGLHQTLRQQHGVDPADLPATGRNLAALSSTHGAGGVLDVYYPGRWKFDVALHPKLLQWTQQLWKAAYCNDESEQNHGGENEQPANNSNNNDDNKTKDWKWHPYGPFDPTKAFAYIDRIGYRLPTALSDQLGAELAEQQQQQEHTKQQNSNKKNKKKATLQRGLTPHLDCCPETLDDVSTKSKWRPIQCFVALTDDLQANHGGFEAARGFHQTFRSWQRPPTVIVKKKKKQQQQQKNQKKNKDTTTTSTNDDTTTTTLPTTTTETITIPAACVGEYTHIRPTQDAHVLQQIQHVPVPAGAACFWEERIPHANAYRHDGAGPRAVVYASFLPDIAMNRRYVRRQLRQWKDGGRNPSVGQWVRDNEYDQTNDKEKNEQDGDKDTEEHKQQAFSYDDAVKQLSPFQQELLLFHDEGSTTATSPKEGGDENTTTTTGTPTETDLTENDYDKYNETKSVEVCTCVEQCVESHKTTTTHATTATKAKPRTSVETMVRPKQQCFMFPLSARLLRTLLTGMWLTFSLLLPHTEARGTFVTNSIHTAHFQSSPQSSPPRQKQQLPRLLHRSRSLAFISREATFPRYNAIATRHAGGFKLLPRKQQRNTMSLATILMAPRWVEGDKVYVNAKGDNQTLYGFVQEHKGNGWYVIQSDDGRLVTCRSSSLQKAPSLGETSLSETAQPETTERRDLDSTLSQPSIIDLDATVQSGHLTADKSNNKLDEWYQAAYHSQFNKWIVFTDLHVSPSSLGTCLEVLKIVHDLAVERGAGVIFLGDFWHHRVTLRVDALNAVLEHLQGWTVPMIMIPGNHDQVTLGGVSHSLTPLANAYRIQVDESKVRGLPATIEFPSTVRGPLILSQPTQFANALFIPFIRDSSIMENILQSPYIHQDARTRAIFCHVDIAGAWMNDAIPSSGGVPPYLFPRDFPIYTGHFHKPHNVTHGSGIQIQYVGSPYQTTFAEAGQVKTLSVLNRDRGWQIEEQIPIDVGRRHFRPTAGEFLQFVPPDRSDGMETGSVRLRQDDKVVVTVDPSIPEETISSLEEHSKDMLAAGVDVEIRHVDKDLAVLKAPRQDPGAAIEDLSIETTWELFLEEQQKRGLLSSENAGHIRASGLKLLKELEQQDGNSGDTSIATSNCASLDFDSVTIEGYGPFRDKVVYPLDKRGLVLLRGQAEGDLPSSDENSNGSGKSTLAMAALWALCGSTDPKPDVDVKVSDVIHEGSRMARVVVNGRQIVGGEAVDFSVTRTRTKTATGLSFVFNGEDLSRQSATETQATMQEILGIHTWEVLGRTIFHGQFNMNGLLECTNAQLKEELTLVVSPLTMWQLAAKVARKQKSDSEKRANELKGMLSIREEDAAGLKRRLVDCELELNKAEGRWKSVIEVNASNEDRGTDHSPVVVDESQVAAASFAVSELENSIQDLSRERDKQLKDLASSLESALEEERIKLQSLQKAKLELNRVSLLTEAAAQKVLGLQEKWGDDTDRVDHCPTCGQTVNDALATELRETAEEELSRALAESKEEEKQKSVAESKCLDLESEFAQVSAATSLLREKLKEEQRDWSNRCEIVEDQLNNARRDRDELQLLRMESLNREIQEVARREAQKAAIKNEEESVARAKTTVKEAKSNLEECIAAVEAIALEREECHACANEMKLLIDAFGPRGVQSFVFRNTLETLERLTQQYLGDMSNGMLRLELYLDAEDRIVKRALVKNLKTGIFHQRPMGSLSGGQWRRCSLSLQLGFAELVAQRGILRSRLLVLDEPLTHLDRSGRTEVGRVLRSLLSSSKPFHVEKSTILLILQDLAAEELEEAFDEIDVVFKSSDGSSTINVDSS